MDEKELLLEIARLQVIIKRMKDEFDLEERLWMNGELEICPNGEGDPWACESFCALCEGSGQVLADGRG